jgi:hypothetical protein
MIAKPWSATVAITAIKNPRVSTSCLSSVVPLIPLAGSVNLEINEVEFMESQ